MPYVAKIRALIGDYQSEHVSTRAFESQFLKLHSEMPASLPVAYSDAIDELFWAVEAFVADPELRADGDLDDEALRSAVAAAAADLASDA